jgi:ferredoxin
MPRIVADENTCEGHGMCEAIAEDFFHVGPEGRVQVLDENPPVDGTEEIRAAVLSCPTMSLRLLEE